MKKKLIIGLSTGLLIIAVVAVVIVFVVLKPFENKHTHDYGDGEITQAATCTQAGVMTYTCSCGDSYTEAIPATGHTEVSADNGVAPTCTTVGKESDTICSVCGETLSTGKEIPKTEHSWDNGEITQAAICTATGIKTYTCTVCGETKTETISATGHTEVTDEAVAPTCTEAGKTAGSHCSVCGAVIKAQEVVPAAGHTFGEWTETRTNCEQAGERTRTCSVCGYEQTEQLSAGQHSWNDGEITQEATCTETGVETFTCLLCGETKTETIPAAGHTEVSANNGVAPTCTAAGKESDTVCSVCGETLSEGEEIPATGHSYESKITKPATCTEAGVITYTCSCGDSYTEAIPKTEHSWNAGEITKAATCTATGIKTYTCTVCKTTKTEIISATGHDYTLTKKEDATCTQDGYLLYTCTRCNGTKKDVIPATGHYFGDDNVCDNCGYEVTDHEHTYVKTVVAPGCTTMGYTEYVCSCGASYRTDYIDQKGHSWNAGEVTLAKTCSSDGLITYTCTVCKATKTEIIKAGHEWSETVIVAATCTTDGKVSKVCTACGAEETEVIPASHSWNEGTATKAATCTTAGVKVCTCTVCGATQTFEIPALGHHYYNGICTRCGESYLDNITDDSDHLLYGMYFVIDEVVSNYGSETINEYGVMLYVNEGAKLEKVAVYLTQEGALWRRCIACTGTDIEFAIYVPYLSYGAEILYTGLNSDMINTFALSQGADGIWRYNDYTTIGVNLEDENGDLLLSLYDIAQSGAKTRLFGNLSEMILWLKGETEEHTHSYESKITKAATCTEAGVKTLTCSCGDSYTVTIPALGHSYTSVVTKAATCTQAGIITYTCTRCNYSDTVDIYAEHSYALAETKAATCTVSGYQLYRCTVCNDEYKIEIPAGGGHDYVGTVTKAATTEEEGVMTYVCSVCGDSYTVAIAKLHSGDGYVLLIQDNLPWTTNNNTVILNYLTNAGYISGWDITTSSKAASLDFSQYDIIYIANDQSSATYSQLKTLNELLATFAESGGVLIYGACDNGWAGGNISYTLPGGVTKSNYYSNYNYIVDDGHDIITGALTGGSKITNAILYSTYSSHTAFYGMPEGYNVILQDAQGNPTLVEYPLGEGYVIASGLTWEYTYERTFVDGTSFAKEIYDDLFVYAMTLINACEHEYGAGKTVAPTCEEQGYTKHVCAICGREYRTDYVLALGHTWDDGVITKEATCTETGEKTFTCSVCGEIKTETIPVANHTPVLANNGTAANCTTAGKESDTICSVCEKTLSEGAVIPATGHSWDGGVTTQAATCTATGVTTYTCTVCDATMTETIAALGHNYVSGVCTRCGAKEPSTDQLYTRVDENGNESSTGKYILFGSYPQSQVTDSATLANLTLEYSQTTMLPSSANANGWTDYGYYISGSVSSYMWYKDVTYSGNEYRAVYFTSYRPWYTGNSSSTDYTYQDDNGYYLSTVYWFKYEPIKWRILEESGGTAFLMADIILDSQQYYHQASGGTTSRTAVENYNDAYYAGSGSTVTASAYANNYLYSEIRSWLNETFYETAFTEYEKQLVQTTLVDNSAASTTDTGGNLPQATSCVCANTNDKVFLLSEYEVTNSSYGFASYSTNDTARQLKSTAYAKSQGCLASTSSSYLGNGWWWLRSPYNYYSYVAIYIRNFGDADFSSVNCTCGGVVPALHIRLS